MGLQILFKRGGTRPVFERRGRADFPGTVPGCVRHIPRVVATESVLKILGEACIMALWVSTYFRRVGMCQVGGVSYQPFSLWPTRLTALTTNGRDSGEKLFVVNAVRHVSLCMGAIMRTAGVVPISPLTYALQYIYLWYL